MIDKEHNWNVSYKPSIQGFIWSLILILAMYRMVEHQELSGSLLTFTIYGLGILTVLIQLFFFLHVGMESKPHWISLTFIFMVLISLIIVGGSLWIMNNLDYNAMMPMQQHGAF